MRYSRVIVLLGLIAAISVGGVALASGASRSARARPAAAVVSHAKLRQTLQSQVQQFLRGQKAQAQLRFLGSRPLVVPPPILHAISPGGGTCFVSGCSETPCVIPVHVSSTVSAVTSDAVAQQLVARPVGPVTFDSKPHGVIVTAPAPPRLQNQSCPGGHVRPQTLRVSGP